MTSESRFENVVRSGLRLHHAPRMLNKIIRGVDVTVMEAIQDDPDREISGPVEVRDSYIVNVMLSDFKACEFWENGRHIRTMPLPSGSIVFTDLKRDPRFVLNQAFHAVHFQLPRAMLDAVAEDCHAPPLGELGCAQCASYDDPVIHRLATAMLPALAQPERANGMFVEYMSFALAAHVARAHGGLRELEVPPRGGLARWQERRACELMAANLDGEISVHDLATECRLSTSHFARAFRQTTGMPPHRWLLRRRIEAALELMKDRQNSLVDIALATGFASQSHFSDTFRRHMGMSPACWRRTQEVYSPPDLN